MKIEGYVKLPKVGMIMDPYSSV